MREGRITFGPDELAELEALYRLADRVVPMRAIHRGDIGRNVIGLRHDVDDNRGSLDVALQFARWEADRGYGSTYFLLHGSHYWPRVQFVALELATLGHEVGIHVNALAESLRTGSDPLELLAVALRELRSSGVPVIGAVAHGDPLCYRPDRSLEFVNDEIFLECPRPEVGSVPRVVRGNGRWTTIEPVPLATFGLEYESNRLPRGVYLSDSGSRWSSSFDDVVRGFSDSPQLHLLVHPDWWATAFSSGGSGV